MQLTVCTEAWPLVVVDLPPAPTDADFAQFFDQFDRVYDRGLVFATLIDASALQKVPGAKERKALADWAAAKKPLTQQFGAGTAYVIKSPVVRAALTAIDWLFQPPCPQVWKTERREALDWCVERLAERSIPSNDRIDALLSRVA